MLQIRKEQMAAFEKAMKRSFENRVVAHLRMRFPQECRQMPEEAIRETIRTGIARAEDYGVHVEHDVVRYIELMYRLSPDFDSAPSTPWAAATLRRSDLDGHAKMNELCARADRDLPSEAVGG